MDKISRLMSTQHPDNVNIPFFSEKAVMEGDEEIKEAFYTFSHLGIDEQLWDAEGKEVDNYVVKKLFSRYADFFERNILGKDKFLTFRVPNPDIEKNEGKILLESLNSIPRNFDLGKAFYQHDIAPVFEVILPMCSSEKNLIRIHEYYKNFIIKNQHQPIYNQDISVGQWLGKMGPDDIRITPLFETKDAIINADIYTEKYMHFEKIKEQQRVWFARSDPALNYGSLAAVMIAKIGVFKLHQLQERSSIDILPIFGCGSAPFRGNFKPTNVKEMLHGYPNMHTFTVQSAFKYDYPVQKVVEAIETIKNTQRKAPLTVDLQFAENIIEKTESDYQKCLHLLAKDVNMMSTFVPARRKRKLHVGLFGYARENGGVNLPRAIKFCASLYSLGLPPEVLGLSVLNEQELDKIREIYKTLDSDMDEALQYFNKNNLNYFPIEIQKRVLSVIDKFQFQVNEEHQHITTHILDSLRKNDFLAIQEGIIDAGKVRRFLG